MSGPERTSGPTSGVALMSATAEGRRAPPAGRTGPRGCPARQPTRSTAYPLRMTNPRGGSAPPLSSSPASAPPPPGADGEWPADWLEPVTACPVCGDAERRVLHAGLRDRVFGVAPGSWTLMRCRECRAAYLDPRRAPRPSSWRTGRTTRTARQRPRRPWAASVRRSPTTIGARAGATSRVPRSPVAGSSRAWHPRERRSWTGRSATCTPRPEDGCSTWAVAAAGSCSRWQPMDGVWRESTRIRRRLPARARPV